MRNRTLPSLKHNRRGIFILSDMMWFLVFIIAALLIFYGLYQPLRGKIENKVRAQDLGDTDANYVALSLLNRHIVSAEGAETARTLTQEIQQLYVYQANNPYKTIRDAPNYGNYQRTLNKTFLDSPANYMLWSNHDDAIRSRERAQTGEVEGYIMFTQYKGEIDPDSCVAYRELVFDPDFCDEYLDPSGRGVDPETGIRIPTYTQPTSYRTTLERGTAFIPTTSGPVTLHVWLVRKGPA